MYKVVFLRHGQSGHNMLGRYAGWLDCELTSTGVSQAVSAGQLLRLRGYSFDAAYTSRLKRASETLRSVLGEMGSGRTPVFQTWRLNERHYGALDDLTRSEAESKFGHDAVRRCREEFCASPPESDNEARYASVSPPDIAIPRSESMQAASLRCVAYWDSVIVPAVSHGNNVLVVAHGEILRLLTGHLLKMTEDDIIKASVAPNATPAVFELNDDFSVSGHYLLTDVQETVSPVV